MTPAAIRSLQETLPPDAAFAAWEFINGPLADAPRILGRALNAPFEGQFRARRGEYRVRYQIDDERHRIVILSVRHRRDAYRS